MIIQQPTSNQSIGQATATIKTDGGYQTVPVILQHGNSNQVGNIQIQKQMGGMGQQIIQPVVKKIRHTLNKTLQNWRIVLMLFISASNAIHASNQSARSNLFSSSTTAAASESNLIANITTTRRRSNKNHHYTATANTNSM